MEINRISSFFIQSDDPRTDFRGAGIIGLKAIIYFI